MEKVIYVILFRQKDTFDVIYVGDCEKTEDNGFFTKNRNFKCWISKSGHEKYLYLAILPMFDSVSGQRAQIISKIISKYHPVCNNEDEPNYTTSSKQSSEKIICPCCGSEMKIDKVLQKSIVIKCSECGLSDTKLSS